MVQNTLSFIYAGDILAGQSTDGNVLAWIYDNNGKYIGFTYNGSEYYYIYNLQGDVEAIADATGTIIARYIYGPWGTVDEVTDNAGNDISGNAGNIANINPIRYRGYYYDTETGFYYLQSRYYDPEICRFINADGQLSIGSDMNGMNLFAYCGNNPVNRIDPTGEAWWHVAVACLAVAAVCAVAVAAAPVLAAAAVGAGIATTASSIAMAAYATGTVAIGVGICASGMSIAESASKSKRASKTKAKAKDATLPPKLQYNYWEADLIAKKVVVSQPLSIKDASLRVAAGGNIMCRNKEAAQQILFLNGYINAVGPEKGCGNDFYWHYHPTRNHTGSNNSIHIWYYE